MPETDVRCVPNGAGNNWYWAFTVDGKPVQQGTAESYQEGIGLARKARWDWEDRDRK